MKGFIKCSTRLSDENAPKVALAMMTYLQCEGVLTLKAIDISSVHGLEWEIKDPEVETLKKRIEDLEETNSRLYRQITESYDRRSRRVGVE